MRKNCLRKWKKWRAGKRKTPLFGFTMIELLLVMALIGLLGVGGLGLYSENSKKTRDARRLADMDELETALDNYYDDFLCYPDETLVNDCGGAGLQPYIEGVACDPVNNESLKYSYVREDCKTYRVYIKLENEKSELIDTVGCSGGCGVGGDKSFNYFVASSNVPIYSGEMMVEPNCGDVTKYCYAEVCGTCCPGANYRCSSTGDSCLIDVTCSQ